MARDGETIHRILAETVDRHVRIIFNGVTVADSTRPILMTEGGLTPVYYFPRADVRMDLMERTSHKTHCPFKGNAAYWSLTVGDRAVENAVWSYEDPHDAVSAIKGYLAFEEQDGVTVEQL